MKFENTDFWGFQHSFRGMRNPLNSWDKSDSFDCLSSDSCEGCKYEGSEVYDCLKIQGTFMIGDKDLELAQRLIRGGPEHRKFLRQIMVSVDITAPTYFMAELDTYKIGVVRNSTSFMHKGTSKEFEIEDFEVDDDRIIEILSTKKTKADNRIEYHDVGDDDYKIYETAESHRKYKVYKNGRLVSMPYEIVDSIGRTRHFEERDVQPSINRNGYWEVDIGGRCGERWLLHRLVAWVWIDNPNNYETVDHINNNKNDNSVDNLEWVSREENVRRQFESGLHRKNNLRANYLNWIASSKVNVFQKLNMQRMYKNGTTELELSKKFGLSQTHVSAIVNDNRGLSENYELYEECWMWEQLLSALNYLRDKYLDTKDYKYFRMLRQILPQSYLYLSTLTLNYENLRSMYFQRRNHKLTEWSVDFMQWIESLPYAKELIMYEGE